MVTLVNNIGFLNNEILTNKLEKSIGRIYLSNYNREKYNA